MSIILDLVCVVIVICSVAVAFKNGFSKTIVKFLGVLAAILIAFFIAAPAADFIYDVALSQKIQKAVEEKIQSSSFETIGNFSSSLVEFLDELPFIDVETFSEQIESYMNTLPTSSIPTAEAITGLSGDVSQQIIKPIITSALSIAVFLVTFFVLFIIVLTVSSMLGMVNTLPLIGPINALLGGAIGFIQGMLYILIAAATLRLLLSYFSGNFIGITYKVIGNTYIFQHFYEYNNIFSSILSLF